MTKNLILYSSLLVPLKTGLTSFEPGHSALLKITEGVPFRRSEATEKSIFSCMWISRIRSKWRAWCHSEERSDEEYNVLWIYILRFIPFHSGWQQTYLGWYVRWMWISHVRSKWQNKKTTITYLFQKKASLYTKNNLFFCFFLFFNYYISIKFYL